MTRGNQRDINRERNLRKHAGEREAKEGDPLARKAADGKALQEKVEAKRKAEAEAAEKAAAEEAFKKAQESAKLEKVASTVADPGSAAAAPTAGSTIKPKKKADDLSLLEASMKPKK